MGWGSDLEAEIGHGERGISGLKGNKSEMFTYSFLSSRHNRAHLFLHM